MLRLLPVLLFALCSCVATSQDLRKQAAELNAIADQVDAFQAKAQEAIAVAGDAVATVAEMPGYGTIGGIAAALSAAAGVVVDLKRNATRSTDPRVSNTATPAELAILRRRRRRGPTAPIT